MKLIIEVKKHAQINTVCIFDEVGEDVNKDSTIQLTKK